MAPKIPAVKSGRRSAPQTRNAARTRQLLLEAARARFAREGYAAATVRQVATDVGVDASLINRYFGSKAGLFEACLESALDFVLTPNERVLELSSVPDVVVANMSKKVLQDGIPDAFLLLLRPSGDDRAEEARIAMLRSFGEQLAGLAGWRPGDPNTDERLLRSELMIATAFGITTFRLSGLEPLASASSDDLRHYLQRLFRVLDVEDTATENALSSE